MKVSTVKLLALLGMVAFLPGCASIGPPEAPSLELPKPPTDLRAVRKGDKVTLTWTIPARTMDRQSVRYLGKTDVCRSLMGAVKQCETKVGETAPPADFEKAKKPSGKKPTVSFIDTLPATIEQAHPTDFASRGDFKSGASCSGADAAPLRQVCCTASRSRGVDFMGMPGDGRGEKRY